MCEIKKKTAEWKFLNLEISIFFNFSKIYSAEFFLIFPVSSFVCKRFLSKKYGVTDLVFKIDAINGKKWVKFVAMQQDSATLIYDLNAMKGTMESHFKQYSSRPEKSHLALKVSKKQKTVLSHLNLNLDKVARVAGHVISEMVLDCTFQQKPCTSSQFFTAVFPKVKLIWYFFHLLLYTST